MKNLQISIKISLVFALSLLAFARTQEKPNEIGTMSSVTGTVFITRGNRTFPAVPGLSLRTGDSLLSEEGAQASFIDYFDRQYHLSGAANVVVKPHEVTLKRGYLWSHSFQNRYPLRVITANAVAEIREAQLVTSFDATVGKTQVISVDGDVLFANIHEIERVENLKTGQFSFVDQDIENGVPRGATFIGYKSYEKILSLFKGVDAQKIAKANFQNPEEQNRLQVRMPASVAAVPVVKTVVKKEDIKNISEDLKNLYLKNERKLSVRKPRKSNVKIRVFGAKKNDSDAKRMPASEKVEIKTFESHEEMMKKPIINKFEAKPAVKVEKVVDASVKNSQVKSGFESSLKKAKKKQTRHPASVNALISELQNFKQDYKVNY